MAIISTINTSSTKENFYSKTMEENIASMAYDMRLQKEFTCVQVNGSHRYDSNGVCVYCGKDNPPTATLKTGSELQTALLTALPNGGTVTFLGQNDVVDESTYPSKCSLSSDNSYAAVTGYTNSGKTAMVVKCTDAFATELNEDSAEAFSSEKQTFTFNGLNNLRSNNVVNGSKLFYKSKLSADDLSKWRFPNATDLSYAFASSNITSVPEAFSSSDSDMSKLTTLAHAFDSADISSNIELNCITTPALTDLDYIFNMILHRINISFGSNFDASGVTTMSHSFTGKIYNSSNIQSITLPTNLQSLKNIEYAFSHLNEIPKLQNVTMPNLTNVNYAFYYNKTKNLDQLQYLDIQHIESLDNMCEQCYNLEDISAIKDWNTSNVKSMNGTFAYCTNLTDASALSNWDVSNLSIIDTQGVFIFGKLMAHLPSWLSIGNASVTFNANTNAKLKQIAANNDTSKTCGTDDLLVSSLVFSFNSARVPSSSNYYKTYRISEDNSNAPVYAFFNSSDGVMEIHTVADSINVTIEQRAFSQFIKLSTITGLDKCNITVSNLNYSFAYTAFSDISFAKDWDVSNVTVFGGAFKYNNITDFSVLDNWNVSVKVYADDIIESDKIENVTLPSWVCTDQKPGYLTGTTFNTKAKTLAGSAENIENIALVTDSNITSTISLGSTADATYSYMKYDSNTKTIYLYTKGKEFVGPYLTKMCSGFSSLKSIIGFDKINTSNMAGISGVFSKCSSLTNFDSISGWDLSNITSADCAFYLCSELEKAPDSIKTMQKIQDLHSVFDGCTNLVDISALSSINTSNLTNISDMCKDTSITDATCLNNWVLPSSVKTNTTVFPSGCTTPSWYTAS